MEPAANSQSALQPITQQPAVAQRLTEQNIVGLKYFDELLPLFKRLHDDGCQRDKAGNRELHYDQYCLMVLLYLFNPICSSLRAVQQASELKNVQKKLGCGRAALGSLSEAATVFDPERLIGIIGELSDRLPRSLHDARSRDGAPAARTRALLHQRIDRADGNALGLRRPQARTHCRR